MKKLKLVILFEIILLTGLIFSDSDFKMEKDLNLLENETYQSSIISFKGKLDIKGHVKESIVLLGGQLILDGVVDEDVICIVSKVKIGKNAVIKRDLFIIGGSLIKDPNVTQFKYNVHGEFFNINLKKIENSLIPILSDSKTISFIKTIKIILWFIIALIVFAVFPQKISNGEELLNKYRFKVGIIGLISLFIFIFLGLIFIILCFVIIGIPLFLLLILLYLTIFIFGRTVILYYLGNKISNLLKFKNISPVFFILIGLVIYASLKFIPIVGPIILILLNIFEMGIGVGFFLRKKLNLVSS